MSLFIFRMQYYTNIHDIQTLAMLCCVFWNRQQIINPPSIQKSASKSSLEYVPPNVGISYHIQTNLLMLWTQKVSRILTFLDIIIIPQRGRGQQEYL